MAKFCALCGQELEEGATFCAGCGQKVEEGAAPPAEQAPSAASQQPLQGVAAPQAPAAPTENNTLALVAFILGLVSLFINPMGIAGIAALICGIIARKNFNPQREKNRWMATTGLVLGVIMTVWMVLAFAGLAAMYSLM